uniref:Uncharacterized protein n=1 Tax=Salix viminalis TaxID=40686 RepID=A0A6N2KTW8_SALVM
MLIILYLWSPPEEVPVNQSSISCNDQTGQNMLVDNDVINDSFQQTTQFPPSFPQTMVTTHSLSISSADIMGVWYGVTPSFMEDDVNQLDFETFNMSELLLSPSEEVPVNQSAILCNDQAGWNILVDNNVDSIQQTTQFPTSFPQTLLHNIH